MPLMEEPIEATETPSLQPSIHMSSPLCGEAYVALPLPLPLPLPLTSPAPSRSSPVLNIPISESAAVILNVATNSSPHCCDTRKPQLPKISSSTISTAFLHHHHHRHRHRHRDCHQCHRDCGRYCNSDPERLPTAGAADTAGVLWSFSAHVDRDETARSRSQLPAFGKFMPQAATAMCEKQRGIQRHGMRLPIFIVFISLLESAIFLYDYIMAKQSDDRTASSGSDVPTESVLIYRPDRRLQIWRFVSYMTLHASWLHLGFNVVTQLLFGVPLELVHGSLRVAVVYLAGIFAGSLGTSVVDSSAYLVGASGGVYALLAAQLANLLLNYGHIRYAVLQFVSLLLFALSEFGYTIYTKFLMATVEEDLDVRSMPTISYMAHLCGSLAGFTLGLLVLKHFDGKAKMSPAIWWLALCVYLAFTIFAIAFNLINSMTAQKLKERGKIIEENLLHKWGLK